MMEEVAQTVALPQVSTHINNTHIQTHTQKKFKRAEGSKIGTLK